MNSQSHWEMLHLVVKSRKRAVTYPYVYLFFFVVSVQIEIANNIISKEIKNTTFTKVFRRYLVNEVPPFYYSHKIIQKPFR